MKSPPNKLVWIFLLCPYLLCAQQDRTAQLTAAHRYMDADSVTEAERVFRAVTHDAAGRVIVDSLTGVAYHNLGVLAYYADDLDGAVKEFRRAVGVRDKVYAGRPHNERAHSRSNLAYMYRLVDRLDSTATLIREATEIYAGLAVVDSLNWLRSLNELGALALSQENYLIGYSSSYRAVRLSEEIVGLDPYDAWLTHYRAARILMRLNKAEEALPIARRAVALSADLDETARHADALNLLALVDRELGNHEASLAGLTAGLALPLRQQDDALTMAFIRANLAEHYAGEGDHARFLENDRQARSLFAVAENLREYFLLDRIPRAYYDHGDYVEGLAHLDEAISFLTDRPTAGLSAADVDLAGIDIVPLANLVELRGRTLAALERPEDAIGAYELLFELQDTLRDKVADYGSRSYYSRNLRPAFDRAVALYYQRYLSAGDSLALWRAFTLSERARAYSLLATLHSERTKTRAETDLLDRIAKLERGHSLGDTDDDELSRARLALERLYFRQREEATAPPAALDRDQLIAFLHDQACTLLEYHLSTELSLLFVLDGGGRLTVHPIGEADKISGRVADFRRAIEESKYRRKSLSEPDRQRTLDQHYLSAGIDLASQLLPASVRDRDRLCIVPDGSLHYLPFAALPLHPAALPLNYAKVDYLQRHAALRYAYSSTYLLEVSSRPADTFARELTAFAPSFASTGKPLAESRSGTNLGPLRYNGEEVSQIADLVENVAVYRGADATKSRFIEQAGRSRILHLSSHGMVDPRDPNLSFIAFSQPDEGLDRDELLYFNDLYHLPLSSELTVLSACETALGQLDAGETTMSMASAFAAAGARSTVTTLWQVDDEATKNIIVAFYEHLLRGESRVEALHDAQSELIGGEYAHPYYWSGLTLYGMAGPLTLTASEDDGALSWWGWVIAASLVTGLLAYFLKFLYDARPVVPEEEGTQ